MSGEAEEPLSQACVYLGDLVYDDGLKEFLADEAKLPSCRSRTNDEGRFAVTRIVAGPGEHDFWLVTWKEGYQAHSKSVWKHDGFPKGSVEVNVVLTSAD